MIGRHGAAAYAHMARVAFRELLHLPHHLLRRVAQHARAPQQHLSHGREPDAAAFALEQRAAERLLQSLYAFGQRGLAAREMLRRMAEVAHFGRRLEVAQVTQVQVHGSPLQLPKEMNS
ncbi:hypothetical protein D3C78_1424250 [compost metagenome]